MVIDKLCNNDPLFVIKKTTYKREKVIRYKLYLF